MTGAVIILRFAAGPLQARGKLSVRPAPEIVQVSLRDEAEVPFTLEDGYLIVVQARIGQKNNVRFALDTGSTYSVLRADLAAGFEITRRRALVVNLEGLLSAEQVNVTDFRLGPLKIPQLAMLKNELSYLRHSTPDIGGLIGLDVLRSRSFSIDFATRKIKFGPQRLLRSTAPIEFDPAYLAVEVRMLERPVRLMLDTGARTIMLYRDRMADRLPDVRVEQRIRGASLSGATVLEVVTLPPLQLNGTQLGRRAVLLSTSPASLLPGVDGYLSIAALGARHVCFDFERRLLSWE